MSNVLPLDTKGRWSRPVVDAHGRDYIITTLHGKTIKTRVVRSRYIKNSKGTVLKSAKAIRRALAHGVGCYRGSMVCKICKGQNEECHFCISGIPKNVCGDCNQPLPGCACLYFVMREKEHHG